MSLPKNARDPQGLMQARLQEAERLLRTGQFSDAAIASRAILAEAPQMVPALQILGLSLVQLGDHEDAERAFRAYIAIRPNSAAVHTNLGNLCLLMKNAAGAE